MYNIILLDLFYYSKKLFSEKGCYKKPIRLSRMSHTLKKAQVKLFIILRKFRKYLLKIFKAIQKYSCNKLYIIVFLTRSCIENFFLTKMPFSNEKLIRNTFYTIVTVEYQMFYTTNIYLIV